MDFEKNANRCFYYYLAEMPFLKIGQNSRTGAFSLT